MHLPMTAANREGPSAPMIFKVRAPGTFGFNGQAFRCALGRSGVISARAKREGDGATPIGVWPLRRLLYRADRLAEPKTRLPSQAIAAHDGWCDAPNDKNYNREVRLPYPASAEHLWREDHVYDLIVILGYNDSPPEPLRGSAIFLHCARPNYTPTEGCVALAVTDLLHVLAVAGPGDALEISR